MPLMRGAADLLDRLEVARETCRRERLYIEQETRKLLDVAAGNREATKTLAHNIQIALGNIRQAEEDIELILRDELRPKLERQSWRETRRLEELEKRMAALEKEVEDLRRPKNVVDLNESRRKEGQAK
jgi:nitrogen-specific signal transduction histidine kinase